MTDEYIEANRANWDERVANHVEAYEAEALADDPTRLSGIVVDDAELMAPHLPDGIAGLDLLHLQCHIGTDTITWARLGANVTGTDFSGTAIEAATRLAARAGVDATFVQTSNEDAPSVLGRQYDVVYTSIGVLVWLPRLDTWARAVHDLLRPGGLFFIRDGHPAMMSIAYDRDDDLLVVENPYFPTTEPQRDDSGMTYISDFIADNKTTYEWSHPLEEIIGSVLAAGLRIESFREHATMSWKGFPSLVPAEGRGWQLAERRERLPLEFSLAARRPTASGD